jgi:hypothetical protein
VHCLDAVPDFRSSAFPRAADSGNHGISFWVLAPRTLYCSGTNCHLCVAATQSRQHHASGAEGLSASWGRASSHFNGSWEPLTVQRTNAVLSGHDPHMRRGLNESAQRVFALLREERSEASRKRTKSKWIRIGRAMSRSSSFQGLKKNYDAK